MYISLISLWGPVMETHNVFTEYFKNQALGSVDHSHSIEHSLLTGYGFYKRHPW